MKTQYPSIRSIDKNTKAVGTIACSTGKWIGPVTNVTKLKVTKTGKVQINIDIFESKQMQSDFKHQLSTD